MSIDETSCLVRFPDEQAAAELINKMKLIKGALEAIANPPDDPEERRFWANVDLHRLSNEVAQTYTASIHGAQEQVWKVYGKYRDGQADLTDGSVIEEIAGAYIDALYLLGEQEMHKPLDSLTATLNWTICNTVFTPLMVRAAMALDIDPGPIMLFSESSTPENRTGAMIVARKLDYAAEARPAMSCEEANAKARELLKADAAFADKSQRDWSREIGCSVGLVCKLPMWRAVMKRRPKGRKPKAVALTDKLEATIGKDDEALQDLIGEQQADDEPSPLEDDDPGSTPKRVKVRPRV